MKCELIHIVPFDMGISFSIYEDTKKQSKEQFMDLLQGECRRESFTVLDGKNDIVGTVIMNENIACRLFSYGIGVFILKNLENVHTEELEKAFQNEYACKIYYEKKAEQKEILDLSAAEVQPIKSLMQIIWNIGKNKTREFSASGDYKHEGLSYVLTVYHIVDEEIDDEENRQIDLLMNPGIMREILTRDKWDSIKCRIEKYHCVG